METESESEEIDLLQKADEILFMHPSRKTLLNSLHALLGQFEAHVDTIIKRYKIMTITMLVATGAAIGFSFSGELKGLQVSKLLMAGAACILGMIAISALWYLDIQVFHKFWMSFFLEETRLEQQHPFLTDIINISLSLDNIKARLKGDNNFYIFLNCLLILICAVILSYLFTSISYKIAVLVIAFFLIFIATYLMNRASGKLIKVAAKMLKIKKF